MPIQMFNKQGDSLIVENREVNNHLKQGWTFQPPKKVEKPKSKPKVPLRPAAGISSRSHDLCPLAAHSR